MYISRLYGSPYKDEPVVRGIRLCEAGASSVEQIVCKSAGDIFRRYYMHS